MVAIVLWLLQVAGTSSMPDTLRSSPATARDSVQAVGADSTGAPADTARSRRVVREFPVEVRALLYDLRASQTVHEIPAAALRAYPVDRLAEVVTLKPGVIALADELHVRGGRAGETLTSLEGVSLGEPLRHRPMELPLLALRSVDLVSGTPETSYAGSLAGVLDLHTVDPGERPGGEFRWQSTAGIGHHFDRVSARASAPIAPLGLGVVAAGDVTLDDTSFPALRSDTSIPFGWRAANRLLGYLKLASLGTGGRIAAQVLGSREVLEPYDPAWTLDGYTGFDPLTNQPVFSPTPQPGFDPYQAADHKAVTDDRRLATILTATGLKGAHRGTLTFGWLATRTATTVGGVHAIPDDPVAALFDPDPNHDPFHVIGGDDPLYRVGGSDVYTLRADAEPASRHLAQLRVGFGGTWTRVWQDELDATLFNSRLDSLRSYRATAPGAFVYGQGRWQREGLVANLGLRAEYFTAGPEGVHQTLPGSSSGHWSLLPRIGLLYPISSRDVLSTSYARIDQDPDRDLLYDRRTKISNRQPLGNPALRPATMISYEAALKHLFSGIWAAQAALFYRDVAHQAGARDYRSPSGPVDPRYTDEDQASTAGLELSLIHARDDTHRFEVHYTFMEAWGFESRPEGDPYGPLRAPGISPIGERPLSWDRRHTVIATGLWPWRDRVMVAWSMTVGSPLPWTPKPRRQPATDVTTVNSRRLGWSEITSVNVTWSPPYVWGLTFGLEARNLFDDQSEVAATVDGYPNPFINTLYDDFGAYRTETGRPGGAYWTTEGGTPHWVEVHDPRLLAIPRTIRLSVGRRW